jgi:transcriptional regulator with GAF, ATPase, and Fis domain
MPRRSRIFSPAWWRIVFNADPLESELFGYEKGAFTGAFAQKIGRFEMADTGTLFLDEIGDIPLVLQPKLLGVLQEKEFERLGSGKTHRINVRLVAATHRNLSEMVARKQFRSDLYYRLNVFPIVLPPLRERREDIAFLVSHFVEVFARRMGKWISIVPKETRGAFGSCSWPGNVRELQNLIERAVILSENEVLANPFTTSQPNPLGPHLTNANAVVLTSAQESTFWDSQRALIVQALHAAGWIVGGPRGGSRPARTEADQVDFEIEEAGDLATSKRKPGGSAPRGTARPRNDGRQQLNARASA